MESIADGDDFTINGECGSSLSSNWDGRFVTQCDRASNLSAVGVKGLVVRKHDVGSPRICTAFIFTVWERGEDTPWVSLEFLSSNCREDGGQGCGCRTSGRM
jgi:hypothetical protein